jgi:hypothetical protein
VTWSVADGARGRRWRSIATHPDGRLMQALLLETGPDGRLARLELAAPAGLVTLHPDGDPVRLHGNVVRDSGVEHLALPWSGAHLLFAGVSPITAAVAAVSLADRVAVGEGITVPAVEVDTDLVVRAATWRVARTGDRRWRMLAADRALALVLEVAGDGTPVLAEGATWPLERERAG